MLWKTKEAFAWFPTWIEDIDQEGYRVKVKKVWLCKVVKFKTFWDGWVAFVDDNKHLI